LSAPEVHELDFRSPASEIEWASYHAIPRRVLFELRGSGATHDAPMSKHLRLEIRREDHGSLAEYGSVSSRFEVSGVLDLSVADPETGAFPIRPTAPTWWKDYDAIPDNTPLDWPSRFAVHDWLLFAAFADGQRVGGAIVVVDPIAVAQLGGDPTLALLWDVRVHPDSRRRGVGRALLAAAEDAVRLAGCRGIVVETQDINVSACRLYASLGFLLTKAVRDAYAGAPNETQLEWAKLFPSGDDVERDAGL
jgi:ribosomal protein S18 acetylase RimI-like enzyme